MKNSDATTICLALEPARPVPWKKILSDAGAVGRCIARGDRVLIKPNLAGPLPAAATDLDLLAAVVEIVLDAGAVPLVGESSGYEFDTASIFRALGLEEKLRRYHLTPKNLEDEGYVRRPSGNGVFPELEVSRLVQDCHKIVNLPKVKMHRSVMVSLAMKNFFGLLSKRQRQFMHLRDLDEGIIAVNQAIRPDLVIVDGVTMLLDAAVFGRSVPLDRLFIGSDNAAVDRTVCEHLGIPGARIRYLGDYLRRSGGPFPGQDRQPAAPPFVHPGKTRYGDPLVRLSHLLDFIFKKAGGRRSLLPMLHFHFGVRPAVIAGRCNGCGRCLDECPVRALSLNAAAKIVLNNRKCSRLRCLKCVAACPANAFVVRRRRQNQIWPLQP